MLQRREPKHKFEHRTIERKNSSEFGRDLTQGVAVVRGRSLSHTHRHTLLYCFASTYCSNRHHIPISAIITTIITKVTKQTTASTGGAADRIRKEPQADLGTDVKPYWIDSILTRGQFSDSNVSWKRQGIAAETGPRLPAKNLVHPKPNPSFSLQWASGPHNQLTDAGVICCAV